MNRAKWRALAGLLVVATAGWGCGADFDDSGRGGTPIAPVDWIESSTGWLPLGAPPDSSGLTADVLGEVRGGVGAVRVSGCGPEGTGTAFAIAPGLALTAAHVVAGATQVQVDVLVGMGSASQSTSVFEVEVVGYSTERDLALLAGDLPLAPLRFGKARLGARGAVVGFVQASSEAAESGPGSGTGPSVEPRTSAARIDHFVRASGLWGSAGGDQTARETGIARNTYVLAADVRTGQSGAPLVDRSGNAVGVTFAATQDNARIGFALSRGEVLAFLNAVGVSAKVDYRGETVIDESEAGLAAVSTGECKLG